MKRSITIVASAIFLVTHAPSLQVPLYNVYAQKAGFGSGISAVAFATYVIGLLPTLILFGGISDRVGRKKIILASLLSATLATFLMIIQPNIYVLFVSRVLQGIAVGLITGTGTAYISTIMPNNSAQVATYVSLTSSLGFSSSALFTNVTLFFNKQTLVPLSYWVVFVLTLGCIGFASKLPEQQISKTALVRLPSFPNGTIAPGFAIALAWSLAGIVSLTLPAQLIKYGLPDWSGPMLFIFVISGVLVQPFARRLKARHALQFGAVILLVGYIIFSFGANVGALSLVIFGVISWNPGQGSFTARAGYVAASANKPEETTSPVPGIFPLGYTLYPNGGSDQGLFGAPYQGIFELKYAPSKNAALRLQYSSGNVLGGQFNVFGANAELSITKQLAIFGRYGFGSYDDTTFGDIEPNYWMAGVAFRDIFKSGALAGIAVGQPFIENKVGSATQTNFEAFYNLPVNDNIRFTPLVQIITNPANQEENGTIFTGTLRTVFYF